MEALQLFGLIMSAVLIGVGILLVIAAFVISTMARDKEKNDTALQAGVWDFLIELAKKLPLLYVPGFLMIGLGVVLAGSIIVGADFGNPQATPTPTVSPAAS